MNIPEKQERSKLQPNREPGNDPLDPGSTTPTYGTLLLPTIQHHRFPTVLKYSSWLTKFNVLVPLFFAYITLFATNTYLATYLRSAPAQFDYDNGRIAPLVLVLMLLGPETIDRALHVSSVRYTSGLLCWGCGWLAWSVRIVGPVLSVSGARRGGKSGIEGELEMEEVKEIDFRGDDTSLSFSRFLGRNKYSLFIYAFQILLCASSSCVYEDATPLLFLCTAFLLVLSVTIVSSLSHLHPGTTALPAEMTATRTFQHTTLHAPAVILISGGFLCQALLATQLTDAAATVLCVVMLCGAMGNVGVAVGGVGFSERGMAEEQSS